MHVALTIQIDRDDQFILAQQLGVDSVVVETDSWETDDLTTARNRVEQTGLQLVGVECLHLDPNPADPEAQFVRVARTVRDAGAAGVSQLFYQWAAPDSPAPEPTASGRGESLVCPLAMSATPSVDTARNLLERLTPVAAESEVRLVWHAVGLSTADMNSWLAAHAPSGIWHGIELCSAALADIPSADFAETLGAWISTQKIAAVHLCGLNSGESGPVSAFLDEGEISIPRTLRALRTANFDGSVRAASPPGLVDDTAWGHKGRAFDTGYLKAVLQTLG
jgi:mannonate dehydratase